MPDENETTGKLTPGEAVRQAVAGVGSDAASPPPPPPPTPPEEPAAEGAEGAGDGE